MANVGFSAKYLKQRYGVSQTWFEADFPDFTPNLDRLAHQGLHLTRHYSYTSCTPSRASFLSGRLPVHLGVILGSPLTWDGGSDPTSGYDGLSPNMTIIPRIMRELGYRTHLSGKADGLGMATRNHVPAGRGFESALGYFNHANDFYNYTVGPQEIAAQYPCQGKIVTPFNGTDVIDQWEDFHNANRPPAIYAQCDKSKPKNCPYEDDVLVNRAGEAVVGVAFLFSPPLQSTLSTRLTRPTSTLRCSLWPRCTIRTRRSRPRRLTMCRSFATRPQWAPFAASATFRSEMWGSFLNS